MRRAVSSANVELPTVEIISTPGLPAPATRSGVGCTVPNLPSSSEKSPYMIKVRPLPGPETTDAQWAARLASDALAAGRYDLSIELTRVARRAQYAQDARAQHSTELANLPGYDDLDGRLRDRFRVAVAPLIGATRDEQPARPGPASDTCAQLVETNGSRRFCGAQIIMLTGPSWLGAGWTHADPEITDHQAEPAVDADQLTPTREDHR